MNIAIASTFHPYRGGIATFNDRLAISLKKAGHTVNCFNWSRQYPSFLFPGEAQTIKGQPAPNKKEAPLDSINPRSWKSTANKILEYGNVDVLLLPFWHASLAPALRGVAKRVKKLSPETKIVALMHNASSHDGKAVDKWLTKRFLQVVDSCVVLSDSVKNGVMKLRSDINCNVLFHPLYDHYPAAKDKAVARRNLGIDENVNLLLFFGLIRPYKGLDCLIEALGKLDEKTELLIAGESYDNWSKYDSIIKKLNLQNRIHLINRFVSDSELPNIFCSADCLILPYKQASQSGVVATSIHYNTPIIATDTGDLRSSIVKGKTGALVEPNNPSLLAEKIQNWLMQDNNISQVQIEYDKIRQAKSWDAFASQLFS